MITARKNRMLNLLIYRGLMQSALRGRFDRVNARWSAGGSVPGVDALPGRDIPLILCANHSAWWDGHLVMALNEMLLKRDAFLMMEETQLARYPFFRAAGAFSVNRTSARSAAESVAYATQVLCAADNRLLAIFPQGEILANDVRPLRVESGVGHIARAVVRRSGVCAIVPVALCYEFIGEQAPEAFISVGAPLVLRGDLRPKDVSAQIAAGLTRELDGLRDDVTHYRLASFTLLMRGAPGVNRVFDRLFGRALVGDVGRR